MLCGYPGQKNTQRPLDWLSLIGESQSPLSCFASVYQVRGSGLLETELPSLPSLPDVALTAGASSP